MPGSSDPPRSHSTRPLRLPRFQYSLKWLLIAVTVVAVLLGMFASFAYAFWFVIVAIFWCVIPTPLLIGAIYGQGDLRTFAIGALVPWLAFWWNPPVPPTGPYLGRLLGWALFLFVMSGACGAVAVATRRWIERWGQG